MKRDTFRIFILLFLIELIIFFPIFGQANHKYNSPALYKTNGEPSYAQLNINKISTWFKNDGESDIAQNGNSGFVYPKFINKAAVFQSRFLWGGKIDN